MKEYRANELGMFTCIFLFHIVKIFYWKEWVYMQSWYFLITTAIEILLF